MSKLCHSGPKKVFKIGSAQIWAGAKDEVLAEGQWSLIVSALGVPTQTCPFTANEQAKSLIPEHLLAWAPCPAFGLDWPDRGVPLIGKAWWKDFVDWLKTINGNVAMMCLGGHGRTGTALSIIGALGGAIPSKKDPVAFVRKVYCTSAVETWSQIDYIAKITERKVSVAPSDSYKSYEPQGSLSLYSSPGTAGTKGVATSDTPFGAAVGATATASGGANSTTEQEPPALNDTTEGPIKETLWRWKDETGTFWTDLQGNIMAIEPDYGEDEVEEVEDEAEDTNDVLRALGYHPTSAREG